METLSIGTGNEHHTRAKLVPETDQRRLFGDWRATSADLESDVLATLNKRNELVDARLRDESDGDGDRESIRDQRAKRSRRVGYTLRWHQFKHRSTLHSRRLAA